ncbi:hypothetical protein KBD20_04515, partial [Candidatus Saccharibacteria bacterium]|nr:hypothetical protein [Candidatus Saccharibacteria bacterium]
KELVTPFNATPGETVSYDITLSNNGPMGLDLALADDSLFSDVYPGADLTYVDTSTADVSCLDLGPGSSAYIGPAGQDHPDHQLLACGYNGASQTLAPGEDFTVRLNFMVTNSVSSSFTNYAIHAALPTDLDVLYLSNLFVNATEDILDTTTNENFAKVTYTNPDSIDTDDDGITDSTEDASPNGGDANNDGTPDSEQTNVTSYISTVTSEPVVLEVDDTCSIATTEVNAEATGDAEDNQYQYPLGFIGFSLECGDPGHTATITQYYYNETNQSYILRKYNFNTDTYRTLEDASISNQTIASIPVIRATYQVADGSSLDLDGSTDGNITDPAGLAVKPPNGVLSSTGESLVKVFVMAGVLIIFGSTIVVTTLRCRNKVV